LCEKFGVQGYPTIKYFSKDTSEMGEKYEEARDYKALKKFVKTNSKDPCVLSTQENCNKQEKAFIEEMAAWDEAKVKSELDEIKTDIEAKKTKHQEYVDLFEEQKTGAMATMKLQEEAKTALDKASKEIKYKIALLEQRGGEKKAEL